MISKKVIITGNFGVGKTSVFRRFIENVFSEKYLTTIGVKVDKKTVDIDGRQISLIIWDIAGEVRQDKVPTAYFLNANAIIYVFDVTRPATYKYREEDIQFLKKLVPGSLVRTVGNKKDLLTQEMEFSFIQEVKPDFLTSAKTGENIEELFNDIAKELLLAEHIFKS